MRLRQRLSLILVLILPAAADAQVVRTFEVGAGGRLLLDADRGSVHVRSRPGAQVRVEVQRQQDSAEAILEDFDLTFASSGAAVVVRSRARHPIWQSWLSGRHPSPRFLIEVPEAFDLDLRTSGGSIDVGTIRGDVRVRTSGGSLRMDAVAGPVDGRTSGGSITLDAAEEADLETSGGSIRVGDVRGRLRAETSGGSITVARASDVAVRTSGGGITVQGEGSIQARTSGGSIRASLAGPLRADSLIETSGGSVALTVPRALAAELDARTSGGRVSVDVPVSANVRARTEVRGSVNGGGPLLRLRTSGGSVSVRAQ